jgi:hypothetical protein
MAKKPIFLISAEGKSMEQFKKEVLEAFRRFEKAKAQAEDEAKVYFVKAQKPKRKD